MLERMKEKDLCCEKVCEKCIDSRDNEESRTVKSCDGEKDIVSERYDRTNLDCEDINFPFTFDDADDSIESSVDDREKLTTSQRKQLHYERKIFHRRAKRNEEHRRRREKLRQRAHERGSILSSPVTSGQAVCIDLSFASAMSAKERCRLARQLGRVWSVQKVAERPVALTISGFDSESEFASECRRLCTGFERFKWMVDDRPVEQIFPPERIVYLCPDADVEPLLDLSDELIYVIGGLVDETGRGEMSRQRAIDMGAVCRRLPIEEFMQRSTSGSFNTMLAINQVFQALVLFYETNDWTQTLSVIVPRRCGYVLRDSETPIGAS